MESGEAMTTKEKDELLDVFRNMTLLELSDFIRAFEEEFGVTAAAPVAVTGVTPAEAPAEEAEEQQEFDVILEAVGDKKIQVIKEVRVITKLGLKDAKDLVEKAPVTLLEKADKIVAEQAVKSLADSGATVKLV